MKTIYFLATMDCEPVRSEVREEVRNVSLSGPVDWEQSERAIRGYVQTAEEYGFPVTLFVHPEVASRHRPLLLDIEEQGGCLGLHIHPYKLAGKNYDYDLGAYTEEEQKEIIGDAAESWESAIGHLPLYFRGGYFSANDMTYSVLSELGFEGGSLSNPERVLPAHCSVWAGAPDYIHPAHPSFRQAEAVVKDEGNQRNRHFVEVPVAVDYSSPTSRGAAGETGYEWPYAAAFTYNHQRVTRNIVKRFLSEASSYPVFVTDVHNDQELTNPDDPALCNFQIGVKTLHTLGKEHNFQVLGKTIEELIKMFRENHKRTK